MSLERIQKFFRTGRYAESLEVIESADLATAHERFLVLSYKSLIYCLRGQLFSAEEIISTLTPTSDEQEFILCALNSLLFGGQGKEEAVHENFTSGMAILEGLIDRSRLIEWEAWFHYGLAYHNLIITWRFDRPIVPPFTTTINKLQELPDSGGIEWVYYNLWAFYLNSRNFLKVEEIHELMLSYARTNPGNPTAQMLSKVLEIYKEYPEFSAQEKALVDQNIEGNIQNLELFEFLSHIWHNFGVISSWKGEYSQAEEFFEKALHLAQDLGYWASMTWVIYLLTLLGAGRNEKALRQARRFYERAQANQSQSLMCWALTLLATAHANLGNFDEYLVKRIEALELAREIGSLYHQFTNLSRLGNFFFMSKQDITAAIRRYQEALAITLQMHKTDFVLYGKFTHSIMMYEALSNAYATIGEYDKTLQYLQEATDLAKRVAAEDEKAGSPAGLYGRTGWHYLSVGDLFFKMGKFQRAKYYYDKSKVTLSQYYDDPVYYWHLFYSLVLTSSELDDLDEAERHLVQLKECLPKTEDKSIQSSFKIAEGVFYKKNPRITMKARALELFKSLSSEKDLLLDQKTQVFFNLVELLLWELASTGHESVLVDIEEILARIDEFSQDFQSPVLDVEISLLQSRFELIQGNTQKAVDRLTQLQQYTADQQFEYLHTKINRELVKLEAEVAKWKELADQNTPLLDRIHESDVDDYLADALRIVKGTKLPDSQSSPS